MINDQGKISDVSKSYWRSLCCEHLLLLRETAPPYLSHLSPLEVGCLVPT